MTDIFNNFGYGILANSPGSGGTSLALVTGQGTRFPEAISSDPATHYNLVVWPIAVLPLGSTAEVIRVTAHTASSDTIQTFTRAQEGTSAKNLVAGYQVARAITAKAISEAGKVVLRKATPRADLQAAINAVQNTNKTVEIADGLGDLTFEDNVSITGYSGLKLKGGKGTRFLAPANASVATMFSFQGAGSGSPSILASNAAKSATQVVLTAGGVIALGLAIGDLIAIIQDETSIGEADSFFITRIAKSGISGDTVKLTEALPEAFTTARNAVAKKVTCLTEVDIDYLELSGGSNTNVNTYGLSTSNTDRCRFRHITIDAMPATAFSSSVSYDCEFDDIKAYKSGGAAGAYASIDILYASNPRVLRDIGSEDATGFAIRLWSCVDVMSFNMMSHRAQARNIKHHHVKRSKFFGGEASYGVSSGLTPSGVSLDVEYHGWKCEGNDSNNLWWPSFSQASDIRIYNSIFKRSGSAYDVAINSGIDNLYFQNVEYDTLNDTGATNPYIFSYIPLIPTNALVTSAFGNIGDTPHIEVANGGILNIIFQPVVVPDNFQGYPEICYELASSIGGDGVGIAHVVSAENLDAQSAVPTSLLLTGGERAVDAAANKTNLIVEFFTTPPSRNQLLNVRVNVDRTAPDSNNGTALLKNFFLRYRRR